MREQAAPGRNTVNSSPRAAALLGRLILLGAAAAAVLLLLARPVGPVPPFGVLLDPVDGLYRTARQATPPRDVVLRLSGLEQPVTVLRDERGVPHIFAASDRDAIVALGYVTAQDRLFQMDFITRVASGRLSEALGPSALSADRFLRRTGMAWGARRNLERIEQDGGIEHDLWTWYAEGVNAYVGGLAEEDEPFEFRLLGYRPEPFTALTLLGVLQYMTYDLTFRSDEEDYAELQHRLGPDAFGLLYPRFSKRFVPIIPERGGFPPPGQGQALPGTDGLGIGPFPTLRAPALAVAEGFIEGKGSNNWAVAGSRSTTGAPILAGDMHLQLTLPAIWYEVHLVTPTMNTYGVTVPGAPLPVEAFNDRVAWTFTNTGADQVDHLLLELDDTRTRYRYQGQWRDLERVADTLHVKGEAPRVDTLYYAHWGPVLLEDDRALAVRWVAHDASRTARALWGMNHAENFDDFQAALRYWDTPMQNILYADVDGNIAIRSTGYLPVRQGGGVPGLLDGGWAGATWTGRVPFEELPHATNPAQGYLTSTNQQPADSLYPHYLGHDWRSVYRGLRIDSLLRAKPKHSVEDLMRYQADVHVVQHDLYMPLLDTLRGLTGRADTLRRMLAAWDGDATVDRPEPLVLDVFLDVLHAFTWDESLFDGLKKPADVQVYNLLRDHPQARWLDVQATPTRENAAGLLRLALAATADTLAAQYGSATENWRWGDHHQILFRHVTGSEALRPLWRGPYPYPGFDETLSPAGSRRTTHSASWRVVVDLSTQPPTGYGVYPGGQSGNPFSPLYDRHIPTYVGFEYYELLKPATPEELGEQQLRSRLRLLPAAG